MMKLLHPHALALLTSSSELSLASFRQRRVDGVLRTPATREQLQRALQRAQAHRESLHPTA
jgi:CheY-like chemotaxis protein